MLGDFKSRSGRRLVGGVRVRGDGHYSIIFSCKVCCCNKGNTDFLFKECVTRIINKENKESNRLS